MIHLQIPRKVVLRLTRRDCISSGTGGFFLETQYNTAFPKRKQRVIPREKGFFRVESVDNVDNYEEKLLL